MLCTEPDYHLCSFDGGPLDGQRVLTSELAEDMLLVDQDGRIGVYSRLARDRMRWRAIEAADLRLVAMALRHAA